MPNSKTPVYNGLVGLFVHKLMDGKINEQGRIITADGGYLFMEMYSWMDGSPNEVVPLAKRDFYRGIQDGIYKLYGTDTAMNDAHEKECRARGEWHE